MTLYKQIAILVTAVFIVLLFTIFLVSFSIIKNTAQKELYENAQNSVSNLSLSLLNKEISEIETIINASFDNSNYERISYKNINGEVEYQREIEEKESIIPEWFKYLIDFEVPVAKATLSKDWQIIGIIEILNDKTNTYINLYNIMIKLSIYLIIINIIFLTILSYLFHILLKPLLQIEEQANSVMKNKFIMQKKLPITKEFRIVVKSINSMVKKFEKIFKTANSTLKENKELLYTDSITNIANRKYFILKASEFLGDENKNKEGTLIILSIKKAYLLNQTIGYRNTNKFIFDLAQYINLLIKDFYDVLFCRLSGPEMTVMLPDTKLNITSIIVEKIIHYIGEKLDELNLDKNKFGVHLAILEYQNQYTISELFGLIDYSLEQAKLLPQGKYYTLTNSITIGKDKWRENIKNGLQNDNFNIIYRKVVDVSQKQLIHNVVSFSLTCEKQTYSYGELIAPVVDLGMIEQVYLYIVRKVLISKKHKLDIPLTIQLSSQFLDNIDTYEKLKYLFVDIKNQITNHIIFEIPESSIINHYEKSLLYIKLFREFGFDFGINSFIADSKEYKYIKELQPLFIKADKKYLMDISQNISMLKIILESFDIKLIATGIININQMEILENKNISIISGKIADKLY